MFLYSFFFLFFFSFFFTLFFCLRRRRRRRRRRWWWRRRRRRRRRREEKRRVNDLEVWGGQWALTSSTFETYQVSHFYINAILKTGTISTQRSSREPHPTQCLYFWEIQYLLCNYSVYTVTQTISPSYAKEKIGTKNQNSTQKSKMKIQRLVFKIKNTVPLLLYI